MGKITRLLCNYTNKQRKSINHIENHKNLNRKLNLLESITRGSDNVN